MRTRLRVHSLSRLACTTSRPLANPGAASCLFVSGTRYHHQPCLPGVLGIDLGSTCFRAAVMADKRQRVYADNAEVVLTLPSVVAFPRGTAASAGRLEVLVGEEDWRHCTINPRNTIYSVRQLLGKPYSQVPKIKDSVPYDIVLAPDGSGEAWFGAGGAAWSPVRIAAMILEQCKETVVNHLQWPKDEPIITVLTVPAMATDQTRLAVKKAAELAGLEVHRIIERPAAAWMGTRLVQLGDRARVGILDLEEGGVGTATILETEHGVGERIATITSDDSSAVELTTEVRLQEQTGVLCASALKAAGLTHVDHVIVAGDGSGMSATVETVRSVFGGRLVELANPAEVVALGAAVTAGVRRC